MWQTFATAVSRLCPPDPEALEAARKLFKPLSLSKNDYFVREGEICTRLGFIYKGLFRSFYVNEKGEEVTCCFAMEGGIETSFRSFISASPSPLSIVAMEDAALLVIEKKDLDILLSKYLFWNQLSRILTENEYLKMTQHADESKTEPARIKYLNMLSKQPGLLQRAPLHYIASYLGISSRHLTRMRKAITE